MSEKSVLVTGATGFVGRHLLTPLQERGFTVHAVARQPSTAPGTVTWHKVDLLDAAARRALLRELRPSHLLHAAWYAEHGQFWRAPENLDWLAASLDLVRLFTDHGGRRLVTVGSCAEYDWQRTGAERWRETDPCRPATLYGRAKLALSEVAGAFCLEEGVSYASGRLFHMYGEDEPPARLVASIARALLAGEPARCSSGVMIRDLLDVRDAAAGLVALLVSPVTGVVNVASGMPVTVAEVARTLGRLAGKSELLALGSLPDRAGEPAYLVADITRLRREVGFTPAIGLERGMRDALAWWGR